MKPMINLESFRAAEPDDAWAKGIRRNAAIAVANDLLAEQGGRTLADQFEDDIHFAAVCLNSGLTQPDMNVIGCASLIAEMVLLYEWDIDGDNMAGGFAVLQDMRRDDHSCLPAYVTRVSLARSATRIGQFGRASMTSPTCGCARCDATWSTSSALLDGRPS